MDQLRVWDTILCKILYCFVRLGFSTPPGSHVVLCTKQTPVLFSRQTGSLSIFNGDAN